MAHTALETAWLAGRPAFGCRVTINAEAVVVAIERAGYDFVCLDCQHGAMNETDAATMVRRMGNASCATLVRVSENSASLIGRVLDAGADGVIVPLVNDSEEAARAVAACCYPPAGFRSFGPSRPGLPMTTTELQGRTACFVMIETEQALANVEAICSVPGIAGLVVGPADLSISLGLDPRMGFMSDQLHGAMQALLLACERNNVTLGAFSTGGANAAHWAEQGCRLILVGGDVSVLPKAFREELAIARGRAMTAASSLSSDAAPETPYV